MAFFKVITAQGEEKQLRTAPATINYLNIIDGDMNMDVAASTNTIMAIYRSKFCSVLLSWRREMIFINHCKVVEFQILRDGDTLNIGTNSLTFHELETEILNSDSELVKNKQKKCLVEGGSFKPGDKVIYCPACRTPYHEKCWDYLKGRCANTKVCRYQTYQDEPETLKK